jgi:hypothetical protein
VFVDGLIYVRNSLGDLRCLDHRKGGASTASDIGTTTPAAPPASTLFASHAELVGGRSNFAHSTKALQLRGTWSIPLRGMKDGEMTWTLATSNRWDQRLDDAFFYTFNGKQAWAVEPQGPRLIVGAELFEHRYLFGLPDLFVPDCPSSAQTAPKPVRFAETACWQVTSQFPAGAGAEARMVKHFFAVATGRLVGREGLRQSTIVLHGSQQLGGLTLPARITRYRAEDGQEHIMTLQAAEWITPSTEQFAMPAPIRRLTRTPAEFARDTAALTKRFAGALARYQGKATDEPLGDDVVKLRVHDGELWFSLPGTEFRVAVETEKDGAFRIDGPPIRISIVLDQAGRSTAIKLIEPDERTVVLHRLPN